MIYGRKKYTPMMQHYLQMKEENPDAILFYRLGDFYEMFLKMQNWFRKN